MIAGSPTLGGNFYLPGSGHHGDISPDLDLDVSAKVCWLNQASIGLPVKFRLATSINIACGQPLLVGVVSALVGDAGDA